MSRVQLALLGLVGWLVVAPAAQAQMRPYIGFVYPAGGQQGTTFQVKLGGQYLEDLDAVLVTGAGVSAKVVEYYRKFGPQDVTLISEQLRELKRASRALASTTAPRTSAEGAMMAAESALMATPGPGKASAVGNEAATRLLMAKIEKRIAEYVNRPACMSISSLVIVEVTMAADAAPGPREIRLATRRGASNPLVFHVGQLPETSRKPMTTSQFEVLGKEELALRKRPPEEVEKRIMVPCTVNGQVASGEENHYRFEAHKGQRLVISTQARQLIPYIADAVPGWFQPVLALYDAKGKEVAYDDDYRFRPDPIILYEVPKDGEYVFSITDAIYRGREDFVYRVTIGELPLVTSIFPLGGRVGAGLPIRMKGWNLQAAELMPPGPEARPGVHWIAAAQEGLLANRVPFALDTLPECFEKEPNNDPAHAQKVKLPIIINGRIDRPDDRDVFQFTGWAGETVVAEVMARRLDSPLDSVLKITDASGKLLALNDDHEDPEAGVNTHDADSYLMLKLPADGTYFVHLADTARNGGEEYAYRLRISRPRPDFALRVVPSSIVLRSQSSGPLSVYAVRKDGFTGPIKLGLKNPPAGFSTAPTWLGATQAVGRLPLKTDLRRTQQPLDLTIEGRAQIDGREIARQAVPAEDRMQAFLWRHLVPAADLKVTVFNPNDESAAKRVPPVPSPSLVELKAKIAAAAASSGKQKFTKQQVVGRLRQLKLLYEEGLLTDNFYNDKVAECEAAQ